MVLGLQILSGAVVVHGELDAIVTATGINSFFGKTMKLLGDGGNQRGHLYKVMPLSQVHLCPRFSCLDKE